MANMLTTRTEDNSALFVPLIGMYITFTFDVLKTLEHHRCGPETYANFMEEVKEFPLRRYIGYVDGVRFASRKQHFIISF